VADRSLKDVERILANLGLKADQWGIDTLRDEEKNVLLPWSARGIIGNGGFKYFYQGTTDPVATARAFRTLGLEEVAQACEKSISIFPGGRWPGAGESWKYVDRVDWGLLRDAEKTVWGLTFDDLLSSIAAYISRRPAVFRNAR
jgi:hypothetical protein